MKHILILMMISALVFAAGCEKIEDKPEINIAAEEKEVEEDHAADPVPEQDEKGEEPEPEITVIEVNATETRFQPSEIRVKYGDDVKLVIVSEHEHNFYAPGLKINKPIKEGETEIYIPTDRKGSYNFWCNMLHFGSQHARMKGRLYIE